ncbi:hypothetical protein EfmJHP35_03160 [Enterococcus faecium]|nr:hypothetical protein EfmJHP35_03160 [Enterococcus faecium]
MMSKNNTNGRNQFAMLTIDDLVPQDHLVRKIDAALDFEFIYPIVEATYSDLGRPSIDPVILIKLVFIQYLFGIRSMRQTIKEVDTNVAYRWFLGYSFEEKIPHFSTFGKNYVRRFRETTVFEDIFAYILEQAVKAGFVTEDNLYLDSTHIKANANKHKFTKEMTHDEAKAYQDELGLPGDLSSVSRFVKATFTKMNAASGDSESESISQFFHILGSVEQQKGVCDTGEGKYEYTIYSSCLAQSSLLEIFMTYEDSQITAVNMRDFFLKSIVLSLMLGIRHLSLFTF